jgi:glutaconate CoA-transferase, subunit B
MVGDHEFADDYTLQELLVAASAREIKDGDVIFAGVGLPTLGAMVAIRTHAPRSIMAMESGCIGPLPRRAILGIGDNAAVEGSVCTTSLWRLFSDQQRGYFDVGMIGGAQVDKYGNMNSTAIFEDGDYFSPGLRLPGSGGANDVASSSGRTVLSMRLERRRFLERVDYITSPGYLDGPGAREAAGLPGEGPAAIITDKCVFRFDPKTKEAYVASLHPGVDLDEVRAGVSWDVRVSPDLGVTQPPTVEEALITRVLDNGKIYTGAGLSDLTFDKYCQMLEDSLAALTPT